MKLWGIAKFQIKKINSIINILCIVNGKDLISQFFWLQGCWALVTFMATITQRNQYVKLYGPLIHGTTPHYLYGFVQIIGACILALSVTN